jgi:hypothetical protein
MRQKEAGGGQYINSSPGSGSMFFYYQQLMSETEEWNKMKALLYGFSRAGKLRVLDAYAIYNPALVSAFVTQM